VITRTSLTWWPYLRFEDMDIVNPGGFSTASDAVAPWFRWVDELADHPVDPIEWQHGLLGCRDALGYWVEASGDLPAAAPADAIDVQFEQLTEEFQIERFGSAPGTGWWWRRAPRDPDSRSSMLGES
jgi:hypothetical protein